MAVLDDNDPILRLSEQIFSHFKGHTHATIIAALSASLGVVLEMGERKHGVVHPDVSTLKHLLRQLGGEVVASRLTRAQRES